MNLKSMLANWQPTVAALVTAFFGFILFSPDLFQPWLVSLAKYAMAGGLVGLGMVSKQHNMTGGNLTLPGKDGTQ